MCDFNVCVVPTRQPARRWNCTKRQKDLSQMVAMSNCVNMDVAARVQISTFIGKLRFARQLGCKIRPSSPSYPIIGDLQQTSSEQCVSRWSYLIPLSGSLPGHHFRPWRCWGADLLCS